MIHTPRLQRRDRGQILVIFAGGLVTLLLLAALVLDGGNVFLQRREGQNTADLQALAGAKALADHYTKPSSDLPPPPANSHDIFNRLSIAAQANDCATGDPTNCTWSARFVGAAKVDLGAVVDDSSAIPNGALGVRVSVQRHPHTYLLGVLGQSTWDIGASAVAVTARTTAASTGQLLPIALDGLDDAGNLIKFQEGQVYDITDGKDGPGSFAWLSWLGSPSAPTLETSCETPDNPAFPFPTNVPASKGKSNKVKDCIQNWIDKGSTVLIPIYDPNQSDPKTFYKVIGMAAFVLTSTSGNPVIKNIQGYFVATYPVSSVPAGGTATPPAPTDTTYFVGLIE